MSEDLEVFFNLCVKQYRQGIHRYCRSILRNSSDAEDVVQDVFVRLHLRINTIKQEKVRVWLYRVARNRCVDYMRDGKHDLSFDQLNRNNFGYGQLTSEEDQLYEVKVAISEMGDSIKVPLTLYFLGDFTAREVAEALGITLGAAKSRIYRGRSWICEHYSQLA